MTEFIIGIAAGIAAHQSDKIVSHWPLQWEMIGRYIAGGLTVILVFVLMAGRLNRAALRDSTLALAGAFGSVGLGVSLARLFDEKVK